MFWQCTKLLILPPHIPWKGQGGGLLFLHYSIIDLNGSGESRSICLKNVTYCRFEIGEWHLEVEGGIEAGVGEIIETDQGEGIFKFREGKIKQIFYIFSLFKSTFI